MEDFVLWKGKLISCDQPNLKSFNIITISTIKLVKNTFIFRFIGSRAILSGPAGGVVGVSYTAYDKESKEPIIGFDMGGTSTDVSRYAGQFDHVLGRLHFGIWM